MADYILRRLSPDLHEHIVRSVCDYITKRCDELGLPKKSVARALGHVPVIVACLDTDAGECTCAYPNASGDWFPVLTLHLHPLNRVEAIIHELTEALLYEWVAPALFHADTVIATDEPNPEGVRHAISTDASAAYRLMK